MRSHWSRRDENLMSFETSFMQAVEKENMSLTEYIELVRRPVSQLTEADINKIYRIGCSVADPGNDVLMSKVISEDTYENYIANGKFSDTIGNSVTRAQDMQDCYTFEDYFNKLGLNYDDNPFVEADKLYVVRYTSPDTEALVTRSYGGNTEADVVRMQETLGLDEQHTFMNAEPYLGTGVTRDVEGGIGKLELMTTRDLEGRPLFCKIDNDAAIYEVDRITQVEKIVAIRNDDKWRRVRYDEQ